MRDKGLVDAPCLPLCLTNQHSFHVRLSKRLSLSMRDKSCGRSLPAPFDSLTCVSHISSNFGVNSFRSTPSVRTMQLQPGPVRRVRGNGLDQIERLTRSSRGPPPFLGRGGFNTTGGNSEVELLPLGATSLVPLALAPLLLCEVAGCCCF